MKYLVLILLLFSSWAFGDVSGGVDNPSMYIEEFDGSPSSVYWKAIVPTASTTENADGSISLDWVTPDHLTSHITNNALLLDGTNDPSADYIWPTTSLTLTAGTLSAGADTDIACAFGRWKAGYMDPLWADVAVLAHYDRFNTTDFALAQDATGNTYLNSANFLYFIAEGANYFGRMYMAGGITKTFHLNSDTVFALGGAFGSERVEITQSGTDPTILDIDTDYSNLLLNVNGDITATDLMSCASGFVDNILNLGADDNPADLYIHDAGGIWIYEDSDDFVAGVVCKDGAAEWQFNDDVNIGAIADAENFKVHNGGTIQVLSAGDDKNIQISHDDTDGQMTSSSGLMKVQSCDIKKDSDNNVFLGTGANVITAASGLQNVCIGSNAGNSITTGDNNVCIGEEAGTAINTGSHNVCIGYTAGDALTGGYSNFFLGTYSGTNCTGNHNMAIGYGSLNTQVNVSYNAAIGGYALYGTTSPNNVAIGYEAGRTQTGGESVLLGFQAGYANSTTGQNVFIGSEAGENVTGSMNVGIGYQVAQTQGAISNTLWIDNSNTATPLIYGDFSTNTLTINGADNGTVLITKIPAAQVNITAADTFIDFQSTTGSEGTIAGTAVLGVLVFNTFTGSHYTNVIDKTGLEPNMLLEIVEGKLEFTPQTRIEKEDYTEEIKDLEGNPILDADGRPTIITKQRDVIKTYTASPKEQLFNTRICSTRKSKSAVGVYGGTDKEGRDMCLSLGTGFMWVANKGGDLEIGDYLISSDVKGCVEKQDDNIYYNYTVAKITQNIKWQPLEQKRLVKVIYEGG
jgi:hypothetical protein